MPLNLWRYCEYTDDGCARYQCLKCYGTWEGRGVPGDYHYEPPHQYVAYWHFCPMCGTKWDGPLHQADEECEYYYGPRRRRVWDAMRKAWSSRPYKEPQHPFAWVIEKRAIWRNSPPGKWEPEYPDKGFSKSLDDLRYVLRRFQAAQAECDHRNGDDDSPALRWEARLVMARPNRPTIVVKSPDPADMEGK